jgi:hypothetical protein
VSAICAPAGPALAASTNDLDYPGTGEASATSTTYVGTHFPVAPGQTKTGDTLSAPEAGAGFDWTSAAIGAGGAGLLVIVSLGGASAASHMRMRTVRS